ncbi:pre-rRNA-processing protein TSR2 homolog [Diorhabda sublineata]|uniref:pre-rRNA-processing protein TSR2 homolog n=1 Tax=Diorhabda sublineata TaxID=1163346 RepID=UPI0024E117BC|nr:pre-rRNA-processing protein TSR2 homolog [Diorhabda sublineata]
MEIMHKVVQQILSNWTGLRLSVEHSMGGPNSKQVAIQCIEEVSEFCIQEKDLDVECIEDFLEDIIDEKFNTIFEDGSPKEIATILFKFVELLRSGNIQQCEEEFNKLPTSDSNWLQHTRIQNPRANSDSSSDDNEIEMSEEPKEDGWTVVQTRRKKH